MESEDNLYSLISTFIVLLGEDYQLIREADGLLA